MRYRHSTILRTKIIIVIIRAKDFTYIKHGFKYQIPIYIDDILMGFEAILTL